MLKEFLFILLTCLVCLTGCSRNVVCTDPTDCWKAYMRQTQCGTYVHNPCDTICDACKFNEPVCQQCSHCVEHDGCGSDGSFCDIKSWR